MGGQDRTSGRDTREDLGEPDAGPDATSDMAVDQAADSGDQTTDTSDVTGDTTGDVPTDAADAADAVCVNDTFGRPASTVEAEGYELTFSNSVDGVICADPAPSATTMRDWFKYALPGTTAETPPARFVEVNLTFTNANARCVELYVFGSLTDETPTGGGRFAATSPVTASLYLPPAAGFIVVGFSSEDCASDTTTYIPGSYNLSVRGPCSSDADCTGNIYGSYCFTNTQQCGCRNDGAADPTDCGSAGRGPRCLSGSVAYWCGCSTGDTCPGATSCSIDISACE